jgi:hypothetical protein
MATNVKVKVATTDKYEEIKARTNSMWDNTDTQAEVITDTIECFKARQFSIIHGWDNVDTLLECLADNEELNIEELENDWFVVYFELNNKARKELEEMRG